MNWHRAPAKINLHLHVIGRRLDGMHELESLVAFGNSCDWLGYQPGTRLELEVEGPGARWAGPLKDNLVLRATHALAGRIPGLLVGRFRLIKRLPTAAGLGGGSADAAAALRALAQANRLSIGDDRLRSAALEIGADVPVCLEPKARMMYGIGDQIGSPAFLPAIFAVLANPRAVAPTRSVFEALQIVPETRLNYETYMTEVSGANAPLTFRSLAACRNDLEPGALRVAPAIADALRALSRLPDAKVVRMSGSGSTCFALFDNQLSAVLARAKIASEHPLWWIDATCVR